MAILDCDMENWQEDAIILLRGDEVWIKASVIGAEGKRAHGEMFAIEAVNLVTDWLQKCRGENVKFQETGQSGTTRWKNKEGRKISKNTIKVEWASSDVKYLSISKSREKHSQKP